ncbi:hypothetical protein SMGD1_0634 [Sulfurimonas gotlandica GD1]|jgi:hypothetical protein|uniref:Uncharacterized protein n=1 Tax=Sulfurimonas gotlandica (strain DSM 19862 / JCM 16533 / GD1) TaxID=929558 RepID=B6BKV0_SULGG|nr:hypothetical protein [Sulfurimonas gotlandica]EDZ62345.1 conserved hypothetical protein [Sulfurimonas gotlandica GD1]EHP29161.1 hypothetical protein SMGD1_0634 [Sulfurimonas gotlandica GD1]
MFVSSYNTYVSTNSSDRTANQRVDRAKPSDGSFESKLQLDSVLESKNTQNLPITYISNYKAFSNKQKMQEEFQSKDTEKYAKINSKKNAKNAYADNSTMFSLFLEPKATQSQTPQVDQKLPSDLQKAQEQNMRHIMVNTYLANDKYYQITA